jgi:lipoprotein-anchoring transpeptidase ErfK/SrfK
MKRWTAVVFLGVVSVVACSREEIKQKTEAVVEKVEDAFEAAVPVGPREDPAARERERFDERWRQLQTFAQRQQQQQQRRRMADNLRFVAGVKESFKGLTPQQINDAPISIPIAGDVAGPSVLKAQVYLDRLRYSVGVLDGRWGRNSAISLWFYQRSAGLDATGDVDETTFRVLAAEADGVPALIPYQIGEDDLKGPFTSVPEDIYEQARLDCLCYQSVQEKLAERFHTTHDFLDVLNPDVNFGTLQVGDTIQVPNVREPLPSPQPDFARVVVSLSGNSFNAFDAQGRLLFHAPTTVGSKYDPSPNETVTVVKITPDPYFHYQPKLFHEVPDDEPEATLKPGPNSPVGVVWVALSKPHFGIHGTSDPESIGYASSHGCIRLTNWDAGEVSLRMREGVAVEFVDTR